VSPDSDLVRAQILETRPRVGGESGRITAKEQCMRAQSDGRRRICRYVFDVSGWLPMRVTQRIAYRQGGSTGPFDSYTTRDVTVFVPTTERHGAIRGLCIYT
jgi:hypothetical protein